MHYRNHENYLFCDGALDTYLRQRGEQLRIEVQELSSEKLANVDESTLTKELVSKYKLQTPALMEVQKVIDAREGDVDVSGSFLNDNQTYMAKGFHITVKVPFSGDAELFRYRASTYSISGTPAATVHSGELILSYQTSESDPEKIKQLWQKDIGELNNHLGWTDKDIAAYNANLERTVGSIISQRKTEALSHQSVIDKIKLG
jgi:hypothetical protein